MCSKALDDRLGCTALLGVADAISTMELDIAVYLVASVQEEFNIRGIVPVLRRVKPDTAIGIDITPSCDTLIYTIIPRSGLIRALGSPA